MLRVRATSLTLDVLKRDISALESGRQDLATLSSQLFGPAQSQIQTASLSVKKALSGLTNLLDTIVQEYKVTCQFLLEDEGTPPSELFGAVQQFANEFSKELGRIKDRHERQARIAVARAASSPATIQSPQSPSPPRRRPPSRSSSMSRKPSSPEAIPVPPSHRPAPPPKSAKRKSQHQSREK